MPDFTEELTAAADAIRESDALLIGAGAGMSVDSGLPDFRGPEGFWKAYPPFRGRQFSEMSNPVWFKRDPEQAWGFFGHRMNLYGAAEPHAGYQILKRWGENCELGSFVFTSNVDGHFQRAGFDPQRIVECHGALTHLQCVKPCGDGIWPTDDLTVDVDMETIRSTSEMPRCPTCSELARPNVLMFGDWHWVEDRTRQQHVRFERWVKSVRGNSLTIVEIGAGTAIPTVRYECETKYGTLIRINPRDIQGPPETIALPMRGLAALEALGALV